MKLPIYATIEPSPNASAPYSIRLRDHRGQLRATITAEEARRIARHFAAIARAAELRVRA